MYLGLVYFNNVGAATLGSTLSVSGNVGIGTASPAKNLHLYGSSGEVELRIQSDTSYCSIVQKDNAELIIQNAATNGVLIFHDDTAERMRIDKDGKVGIGTTGPTDLLTVAGSISGSSTFHNVGATTLGSTLAVSGTATMVGDLNVGDDLSLTSDSAVFNMGDGNDFTITHDGTTGATIAGNPLTLDSGGDIVLDAAATAGISNVTFKGDGTAYANFVRSSNNCIVSSSYHNGDIIFHGDSAQEIGRFDGSAGALLMNTNKKIRFADGGEYIVSNGTDLTIASGADIIIAPAGGDVLPDGDNTRNLGSASKRWANIYTADLHLKNERGNWTVIEEENYLTLRNNKTGKKYKLLMEEID